MQNYKRRTDCKTKLLIFGVWCGYECQQLIVKNILRPIWILRVSLYDLKLVWHLCDHALFCVLYDLKLVVTFGRSVGTVLSWLTARDCNNITPSLTILDKVVKLMEGASDHRFDLVDPSGSRSSRLPSPFDTTLHNDFLQGVFHLVLQCVQNISSSGFGHEIVNAFLVVSPPGRWCLIFSYTKRCATYAANTTFQRKWS